MEIYTPESIKDYFLQYRELMRENEMLLQRLDHAKMKEYSINSTKLDGMPHSKSGDDKMASSVSTVLLLEEKARDVAKKAQKLYSDIDEIICLINGKGYADKRTVLQVRYLDCMSWNDVTDSLFGNKDDFLEKEDTYLRRIHKIHVEALQELSEILNASAGTSADIPRKVCGKSADNLQESLRKIQT